MIIETLSTFPDMFSSVMGASIMRRAQDKGLLQFKAYDLREWTHDRHRTTDDDPFGGGCGLIMKCEPIFEAYDALCGIADTRTPDAAGYDAFTPVTFAAEDKPYIIFLSPLGTPFDDSLACELAQKDRLLFVCGHYEGIDERAYTLADQVISLGDYVLTSGELASMVIIDAVVRKIPGVLGADEGAEQESFSDGLLEFPQYTRPAEYRGISVPPVLLSGDHAKVDLWRRTQQLERTLEKRPDLLQSATLSSDDLKILHSLSAFKGETE